MPIAGVLLFSGCFIDGHGFNAMGTGRSNGPWYNSSMSTLLEQVVKDPCSLSREEQDRAAEVLQAFLDGLQDSVDGVRGGGIFVLPNSN